MSQSHHKTSLGVTGRRNEIARMSQERRKRSRDVARRRKNVTRRRKNVAITYLVSSSSIDDRSKVFSESDVLTWPVFPVGRFLRFLRTARPRGPGRHRAVLLLPVAFKAGGLIRPFGTIPFGTSTGLDRCTSPLLGPKALSLQKLETRARDSSV